MNLAMAGRPSRATPAKSSIVYCKCGAKLDVSAMGTFAEFDCPYCKRRLVVPMILGGFQLIAELGAGAMGAVYRARDEALDRYVAIKLMRTEKQTAESIQAFLREARMAAKLNHPNIVQVHAVAQGENIPYIVMELVDGGHLGDLIVEGRGADELRVLKAGLDACRGLEAACAAGLLHGDIKPSNLLFDKNGTAKIADFGVAEFMGRSNGDDVVWGTPYYVAPERVRRERTDHRADFFSLGATLYHALAGRPPFDGASARAVVDARLQGQAVDLGQVRSGLSSATVALVMRMLALDPSDRHPTHASLLADFEGAIGRVTASRTSPTRTSAGASPTGRTALALTVAGVLVAGGALAFVAFRHREAPPPVSGIRSATVPAAPVSAVAAPAEPIRRHTATAPASESHAARLPEDASGLPVIDAMHAADLVGRDAIVTGLVTAARYLADNKTKPTLLNFGPAYPNQAFTIVIRGTARDLFREPPETFYLHRSVRVKGTVEMHREKPQIEISSPDSIQLVQP